MSVYVYIRVTLYPEVNESQAVWEELQGSNGSVCVYICVCVYILYVYMCVCMYMYTNIYTCMYECVCVYTCYPVYKYIHMYV